MDTEQKQFGTLASCPEHEIVWRLWLEEDGLSAELVSVRGVEQNHAELQGNETKTEIAVQAGTPALLIFSIE